ncbi:hypothetical protein V3C99_002723 [Haemonchus contortus]
MFSGLFLVHEYNISGRSDLSNSWLFGYIWACSRLNAATIRLQFEGCCIRARQKRESWNGEDESEEDWQK